MKVGSLFSGGGLGDFGFMAAGMKITWQCEIDEYCQKILALRYPDSKKYWDIKTLKGSDLESVEIITGGFPCQPFSVAGKQRGKDDDRYLWPEMFRIIKSKKPRWVVCENVPNIVNLALDDVLVDLESEDYEAWPVIFPALALSATQNRGRLFIVANSEGERLSKPEMHSEIFNASQVKSIETKPLLLCDQPPRPSEVSKIPRMVDDDTYRLHRLKMLGNGQVPACTYVIGKMIMDVENIFNPS